MMPRMEPIVRLLPEGWQEKAKELGAFTRRGDYIQDAEDLLRVLLLWSDLGSYGMTESFLKITQDFPMSKVAIYERVKKSEKWLQWMVVDFCRKNEYLVKMPDFLEPYRILVTDATKVSKQGSRKADFVLHSLIELSTLTPVEQHLTDGSCGETMTNFDNIKKKDLIIGDRAYGTITGMNWVVEHGAFFAFRLKANSFNLYSLNENGEHIRFELTEKFEDWEENKILNFDLFYKNGTEYMPVRICAKGKTAEAIEKGTERIKKSNNGKNRTRVTPLQAIYNQFIVLVTNLPNDISAEQVLELYRIRWQIELVFKRLKSVIKYDELQAKNDSNSKAWFWCKLLMAAICEGYVSQGIFFPDEETEYERVAALVVAGIRSCIYSGNLSDS